MGYVVRVDGDRVATAAARLTEVARELDAAGEAMATALRTVAGATGAVALAGASAGAARQWRGGMGLVAAHGEDLARATGAAADSYRAVEAGCAQVWGAPADGGARWAS